MLKQEITTIIFDVGDVLLTGVYGIEKKLEPFLGISGKEILGKLYIKEDQDFFHGKISEKEYWEAIILKNRWNNLSVDFLKRLIRSNFREIPGTREIVECLKNKEYKLGILSDHTKEWARYCNNKFHHHNLFDSLNYSYEIGACKPGRKIYETALRRLGSSPDECLFIDDNENNILGAKKLGINTIQFRNAQQLKNELEKMGISL